MLLETGKIVLPFLHVSAAMVAVRPDVDPAHHDNCGQCAPEYMPGCVTITYLIPMDTAPSARPLLTSQGRSGPAQNGYNAESLPDRHRRFVPFVGCLATETGCAFVERQTVSDASVRPPRP
ncbi:hypothetical protein SAMN04488078_10167 [Antarctobacter heliothermus]|uniref:Uncharacterized protein n=1 Tax=Antarctobacter heliothermus TaxID=74033 RepID=A0A239ENN5_9RHOB|nr:hypothetical protein SAMN04488078_10167 [Antarctobacter heliothermus]